MGHLDIQVILVFHPRVKINIVGQIYFNVCRRAGGGARDPLVSAGVVESAWVIEEIPVLGRSPNHNTRLSVSAMLAAVATAIWGSVKRRGLPVALPLSTERRRMRN